MFFNKNLKLLRKMTGNGLSQEKLAKALKITRSAIMTYESGRAEPKLIVLNRIAQYFNISIERLINVDLEKEIKVNETPFYLERKDNKSINSSTANINNGG